MLARAGAWLDRAAFNPASLPDDLTIGIALVPPVAAGLIIFKLPAAEMLGIAAAFGAGGQILAYLLWRRQLPRPQASPLIAAIVGVALVGAGAPLGVTIAIAALAVMLELVRARYVPAIRAQSGLLAYGAVALITRGAPFAYLNPVTGKSFADPIWLWYHYFGPQAAPIDPIRLYVGNVAGPVFATSLLAVAIAIAWLAYARRLSLVVLVAFLLGALVPIYLYHWDFSFQLDSGPTWFVAGLVLADRRMLPDSWAVRPLIGFGAGILALGLRTRGLGIEAAFYAVAGIQAATAAIAVAAWGMSLLRERWRRNRLLRQRDAQLRVVDGVPRTT
ncbi:MAG TPA: RnfABCDGE type electron transport complex subunit D [Candidatus Dormibacteraeota bacterium]